MDRVRFIEHAGVRVLLLDYTNVMDSAQALAIIADTKRMVAEQPRASLLTLTDVTGSHFDSSIVSALRELVEHNRPYVRAGAVVGLTGLMRVIFTTLVHLTGRNIRALETREEALEYLTAARPHTGGR